MKTMSSHKGSKTVFININKLVNMTVIYNNIGFKTNIGKHMKL